MLGQFHQPIGEKRKCASSHFTGLFNFINKTDPTLGEQTTISYDQLLSFALYSMRQKDKCKSNRLDFTNILWPASAHADPKSI